MEWLWLSLTGFFCRGALTGKPFCRYPRYLLLERSLCFFGIYTFKSKLQKKASVSILSVATLQRLQTLKSPSSHPIPAPTCRIIHTFPLTNSEVNLVINSLTKGLFGLDLQTPWDTQKSNPHSHWEQTVIAKGRCTFDKKCTKFIRVTFSILGHVIYSVVVCFQITIYVYSWDYKSYH